MVTFGKADSNLSPCSMAAQACANHLLSGICKCINTPMCGLKPSDAVGGTGAERKKVPYISGGLVSIVCFERAEVRGTSLFERS